jgi:hypothetical protein
MQLLSALLGSVNKERVLVYLLARDQGHAREIARFYGSSLSPIQLALEGLEAAGALISRQVGSTREYKLNPRYPAREELKALIQRALSLYTEESRDRLEVVRTRPRRKGKPLQRGNKAIAANNR